MEILAHTSVAMKVAAAYLLIAMGENEPSVENIAALLDTVGAEPTLGEINTVVAGMAHKLVAEVLAQGEAILVAKQEAAVAQLEAGFEGVDDALPCGAADEDGVDTNDVDDLQGTDFDGGGIFGGDDDY